MNKQWYLSGINERINTPETLLSLLKSETEGFEIVTVGSSAGGYAAILYGILLRASQVFAFNAQFEINSLLDTDEIRNPLVFRLKETSRRKYYDLIPFIKEKQNTSINYFVSVNSPWDRKQISHVNKEGAEWYINIICFKTDHHGIPFPKAALQDVLNDTQSVLLEDSSNLNNPIFYSIGKIGFRKTLLGLWFQLYRSLRKIIKRKLS